MKRLNNKGVSLAGTLVAVALIGLVALSSLSVFNSNLLQQKHVEQRYGVVSLHNQIYNQLINSEACKKTFELVTRDSITIASTHSSVKASDGTEIYKVISGTGPLYENNMIEITNFTLRDFQDQGLSVPVTGRYLATAILEVKYRKHLQTIGAAEFQPRNIKVQFTFKRSAPGPDAVVDDKKIHTCSAVGGAGDSFWSLTGAGDGIFYNGGKVGIGINAPLSDLHVFGVMTATNPAATPFNATQLYVDSAGDVGVLNYGHQGGAPGGRLDLRTENVTRISILNGGQVGIGTTTPSEELHIREVTGSTDTEIILDYTGSGGGSARSFGVSSKQGDFLITNKSAGSTILVRVDGVGNLVAAGTVSPSDIRYKKNIETLDNSLGKILSLKGVTYSWNKENFPQYPFDEKKHMGLIAQEVEKIYPDLVVQDKDGYKSVNYSLLVVPLIESVKMIYGKIQTHLKEIQTSIQNLKIMSMKADEKINELEEKNIQLEFLIHQQQKQIEALSKKLETRPQQ